MNKGFFVVFLGVILGAMALIFVNQTSDPTTAAVYRASVPDVAAPAGSAQTDGEPVALAANGGQDAETSVQQAASKPAAVPSVPEPATPVAANPEPAPATVPHPDAPPARPAFVPGTPVDADTADEPSPPVKPEMPSPPQVKPEADTLSVLPLTSPAAPASPKPETPTPASPQTKKTLRLVNVGLHFKGNGMALRIEADGPFSYKTFALPSPDRYVVDLVGAWSNMRAPSVPANKLIKGARAGKQSGGPRLVLDLYRAPKKHTVQWIASNVLEIVIE